MRTSIPILHAARGAPRLTAPGLSLATAHPRLASPGEAWFQGMLHAPADEQSPTAWLRALFVTAVREDNQGARIGGLLRGTPLLRTPTPARELGFCFNLGEVLGWTPSPGAYHVHVSAQSYASTVLRVVFDPSQPAAAESPASPVDHLIAAHVASHAGRWVDATTHFGEALRGAALAADLERPTLHNAACAAALALRGGTGAAREARLQQGLEWAAAALAEAHALRAEPSASGDAAWAAARQRLIDATLADDPDLAELRAHPEWDARVLRRVP